MDLKEVVSAYYSIYEGKKKEEKEEKPEKWFDDDGDGKGYEKGEVDGKFDKKKKKKEEDEEEVDEGLEFVDDLTEEELDALVEEMVNEYIAEGLDLDELDQTFEEYLEEAKVTYGHDSGGKSDDDMVSQVRKKKAEKDKKRVERVEKVKSSIKKAIKTVKDAPGKAVNKVKSKAHEPVAKYLSAPSKDQEGAGKGGRGVFLGGRKDGRAGAGTKPLGMQYLKGKTQTSKGRKELRKVLKFDLAQRAGKAKAKAGLATAKAQVGAYQKARSAAQGVKDTVGKAKQSAKNFARKATAAPRKAVKAVRNKTASALSSLADKIKTEGIELDAFDTVTAYLIDEGFATTFDEAQKIMTTLNSELIQEVHQHQLAEISGETYRSAQKKLEARRGKAAVAGDKEGAKAAMSQATRLYDLRKSTTAQKAKRNAGGV